MIQTRRFSQAYPLRKQDICLKIGGKIQHLHTLIGSIAIITEIIDFTDYPLLKELPQSFGTRENIACKYLLQQHNPICQSTASVKVGEITAVERLPAVNMIGMESVGQSHFRIYILNSSDFEQDLLITQMTGEGDFIGKNPFEKKATLLNSDYCRMAVDNLILYFRISILETGAVMVMCQLIVVSQPYNHTPEP